MASTCTPENSSQHSEEISIRTDDEINARILAVSEDKIAGFTVDPLGEIARQSEVAIETVIERLRAMLRAGTIRRVRQTLLATNLAPGALIAWCVPEEKLQSAFDYMFQQDPFSGHVVIRTTDAPIEGARYRLWTTLKVPAPYSMEAHCRFLCEQTGATDFRIMPAKRLFALGVGHVRRRVLTPGDKTAALATALKVNVANLNALEWQVLTALKREFEAEELVPEIWRARAAEAGVDYETFLEVARSLDERSVIGRFATFLEHAKTLQSGERVTRFNALFHWAVPKDCEVYAGRQVGRFHIMTHAYWREGGPEFNNVNIMGVAHGTDKNLLLRHKDAIDKHLAECGVDVSYTNVFWGGRSEIKPSEIAPSAYDKWAREQGLIR